MNRTPVSSSNLASAGWEPEGSDGTGTLEVEFTSGHVYRYDAVPQNVYEGLLGASSAGRYLNQEVIGVYEESRVR